MRQILFASILLIGFSACKVKKVEHYSSVNYSVTDSINDNNNLDSLILPYQRGMEGKMNEIIGFTEKELVNSAVESTLGNFVADVTFEAGLQFSKSNNLEKIDISNTLGLLNFGGLRAPINKGNITVGNVFELMPFDNEIVIVKLEPDAVKEMLTYLFLKHGQPISNAQALLSSSENKLSIGVNSYKFDQPIYVITSDYLANGGDKMEFFKSSTSITKTGILIRDALSEFIKSTGGVLQSEIEGRIEFIK
jgi:2',3'-cyclic-nucleotide 2'-phosphodiesterase (5'-nucleotidase family)